MPTVVLDSSVLIPLALEASRSTRLFLRLRAAGWPVAVSPQILAEVRQKMETKKSVRDWLKLSDAQIAEFLDTDLPGKTKAVPGVREARGAVDGEPGESRHFSAGRLWGDWR